MAFRALSKPEQIATLRTREELEGYRKGMELTGRDWLPGEQEAFLRREQFLTARAVSTGVRMGAQPKE